MSKALDILRVLGHTDWGTDRTVFLRLYRSLVRSKLGYGSMVYGSASKSLLKQFDPSSSRSPYSVGSLPYIPCLYVKTHEPPFSSRRLKLSLNCIIKLNVCPSDPASSCAFEPQNAQLFEKSQFVIPHLGLRVLPHLQCSGLDVDVVDGVSILESAPSTLSIPCIRLDLTQFSNKSTTNPTTLSTVLPGTYFRLPSI